MENRIIVKTCYDDEKIRWYVSDTIYDLYLDYTSGGEICPRFRLFSFLGAVGSIIKRNIWFQRSTHSLFPVLYPNPWVILVAPQGVGHKSSALRIARGFCEKLDDKLKPKYLASKVTPEALVKALATQKIDSSGMTQAQADSLRRPAQGTLYSSELGVLLGRQKYDTGMITLLTDLYDCPDSWSSETVMRGDQTLFNVCLSVMGASTPDWMQTMLPADAFKGGFMSRLLIIGYPEGWRLRVADPTPPTPELEVTILEMLANIAQLKGEIKWTSDAKEYFSDWYHNLKEPEPGPIAAYLERKQDHMLKLAILLQVGKGPDLVLEKWAIEAALNILAFIEPDSFRMIEFISIEPRMRIVQTILEYLGANKGGLSEALLLNSTWKYLSKASEFEEVMAMLLKSKQITIFSQEGGLWYKMNK